MKLLMTMENVHEMINLLQSNFLYTSACKWQLNRRKICMKLLMKVENIHEIINGGGKCT